MRRITIVACILVFQALTQLAFQVYLLHENKQKRTKHVATLIDIQLTVMPYFWDILPIMAICFLHFLNRGRESEQEPLFNEDACDISTRFESESEAIDKVSIMNRVQHLSS